ncbi:MAG: hypothetical protein M1828_002762 [Chrysothrix sp. TS-e1954]|nr:MAG: hypothetical protein M1828_002762 [Chrysothrix sp. TS-e1954]
MPIIRNPFRKAPGDVAIEESGRPYSNGTDHKSEARGTKPLSIRPNGEKSPTEYKLSGEFDRKWTPNASADVYHEEINDSGVYLPPSPTEKPKFWSSRSYGSTTSSSHRSVLNENEPFNISRESFDSYRRSFDISARSPVLDPDTRRVRQSLDARQLRMPVAAYKEKHINPPEAQPEDRFEDVGLDDNATAATSSTATKPRKQGIFSRFGHSSSASDSHINGITNLDGTQQRPTSSHFGGQLFGRRRGTSGQGAELGSMPVNGKDGFVTQQTTSTGPSPEAKPDR